MSTIGYDSSGNGNHWSLNNITDDDKVLDSPTNNFCTLNPLMASSGTVSEGNLEVAANNSTVFRGTFAIPTSGKWYWEWVAIGGSYGMYGAITSNTAESNGSTLYGGSNGGDTSFFSAQYYDDYTSAAPVVSHGSYTSGDICAAVVDMDTGTVKYYKNNTLTHTDSTLDTSVDLFPLAFTTCCSFSSGVWNFGQDSSFAGNKTAQGNTDGNGIGDFYYEPPTGFNALCTQNLPDPDVIPSEHFNTVLYTGNGSASRAITGVGFQPDFVWFKARNEARSHRATDVIRGVQKDLFTDTTGTENTATTGLLSFDSDGFTVGSGNGYNANTETQVAWNWKANGTGVSNTDGTITSTVSANTDAGFSIVSYTGTNGTKTVGHGLNQAPELIINKDRSASDNWNTYHKDLGNQHWLQLNTTSASIGPYSPGCWGATTPTSSVYTVYSNSNGYTNHTGRDYVAYAFHSVEGYSKVGSYTGNGSSDGTFVYTGFRPAYVMIKRTDAAGQDWVIIDNVRDPYNVTDSHLVANTSQIEYDTYVNKDFLSNGFKIRDTSGHQNTSSGTYIYYCVAEHPFKHTNAR